MTELSITRAWSETTEFVKREFGLLFLIAFLLICLPGAALQYAVPATEGPPILTPEEFFREIRSFLLFMPVVVILGMIGTVTISYLAIRPGASVGEALAVGARRFIMVLLAGLLVGLAGAIVFLPLGLMLIPADGTPPATGVLLLLLLVYLVLLVAVWVKLMLLTAIAAAESGGPIALISRSWALTRGWFWKLLGFTILFWIAAAVVLLLASIVVGLILVLALGAPVPGTSAFFALNLISAALQAVVSMFFTVSVARIYAQLTGAVDREIFA